jgi:hypothetical protein
MPSAAGLLFSDASTLPPPPPLSERGGEQRKERATVIFSRINVPGSFSSFFFFYIMCVRIDLSVYTILIAKEKSEKTARRSAGGSGAFVFATLKKRKKNSDIQKECVSFECRVRRCNATRLRTIYDE